MSSPCFLHYQQSVHPLPFVILNDDYVHDNSIDLYIITSREEGGPKALLESFACGVPLVSTKVGMTPELIDHNENGYLVDIEDVEELYSYACKILDNKEISEGFSLKGLKTIKNYDWKKISEKYNKLLYS